MVRPLGEVLQTIGGYGYLSPAQAGLFFVRPLELVPDTSGSSSSCFSGKVDSPLGGHELGNRSMLFLRCKLGEPEFSLLVHLTEGILGIHLREQSPRL